MATTVALCKSIINYAHICVGPKFKAIKYDCAAKVHDFAYILKENPNNAGKIADDLSIRGIPMTFSLGKTLQTKLTKENSHTLFLTEYNNALYGGFLLFGHIPLAYRIMREWKHGKTAFATFINYETQKHIAIEINYDDFNGHIVFENQDRRAFSNMVNNYFPKVIEDCMLMDMKKALFSTINGEDIFEFFP